MSNTKTKTSIDDKIKFAVDYWANFMTKETVNNDNGNPFHGAMADLAREKMNIKVSNEQIDKFKKALTGLLQWENKESPLKTIIIDKDYHICTLLQKALSSFLDEKDVRRYDCLFPMKTYLWLKPDYVAIREGYSGKINYVIDERPIKKCVDCGKEHGECNERYFQDNIILCDNCSNLRYEKKYFGEKNEN